MAPRLPPPPKKADAMGVVRDLERDKRRTQRPVESTSKKRPRLDDMLWHWFNHYGPIEVDGLAVPLVLPETVQVREARIDVAAGSDPATIEIRVNGSTIGTVSWTGEHHSDLALDRMMFADEDSLTVVFTAGSGMASVSIRIGMQA